MKVMVAIELDFGTSYSETHPATAETFNEWALNRATAILSMAGYSDRARVAGVLEPVPRNAVWAIPDVPLFGLVAK